MAQPASQTFVWKFSPPPAVFWPILADTARFNEASGLPAYHVEELPQPDGSVRRIGSAKLGGMRMVWEERPYQWVLDQEFTGRRVFSKGPFEWFGTRMRLEPDGTGSRVTFTLEGKPRGLLGALILRSGMLGKVGSKTEAMLRTAALYLEGERPLPFDYAPPALPVGAVERMALMAERIEQGDYGHDLARRLVGHISTAQEVDLLRMRPLKLARQWGVPARYAVELCLEAARIGLLRLSLDLLCPRCRGAKQSVVSLDQLPKTAHCPSCNITFDANFSKSVELSFRPVPQVRDLSIGEFCVGGPQMTPHVVAQQILAPGERRSVQAALPPGDYRRRTLSPGGETDIGFAGGAFPTVTANGRGAVAGPPAPPGMLAFANPTAAEVALVIESRDWVRDALTAHHVTTMQAFRDLFPAQALRPDEDMAIDNVTLMFTDLLGSTALYERIGDGPAYKLVREHFGFLGEMVRQHDGALVKTIGDAVMAAFADPAQAVRAALAAQQNVEAFNRRNGHTDVIIKMGLHGGPCIAVRSNDRLDYFGSIVNMAARMQGQSGGGEVVLSETLACDPAVAEALRDIDMTSESARLKGFDAAVPIRRLRFRRSTGAPA